MADPNFIILYVDSPVNSAKFYGELLAKEPVELHPTFAMFVLDSGVMLGLWSKHTVEPAATATGGGCEVAFSLTDKAAVQTLYNDWLQRGLTILQAPVQMGFGYTFVALDLDGHRLRVFGD